MFAHQAHASTPRIDRSSLKTGTLAALGYLHTQRMLHRDVKAANVLLTCSGHTKLADFGLCVTLAKGNGRVKGRAGTPGHMAPEVMKAVLPGWTHF